MTAFYMKKWYFDFATDRGETFYAYFITYRIFGKNQGLVSAHLTLPDGNLMQDSLKTKYSSPDSAGKLALGPHFLIQQNGRAKIHMELSHFTIDLQYLSQDKEWIPAKAAVLLKRKKRRSQMARSPAPGQGGGDDQKYLSSYEDQRIRLPGHRRDKHPSVAAASRRAHLGKSPLRRTDGCLQPDHDEKKKCHSKYPAERWCRYRQTVSA